MAQLNLKPEEPMQIIELIESMFKVDLASLRTILNDTTIEGTFSIKRKLGDTFAQLDITIKK